MTLGCLPAVFLRAILLGASLPGAPTVTIDVEVLGASDQASKNGQAPVSGHLERDLRSTLKFKTYREISKTELVVATGTTGETTLPNGGRLRLTPLSQDTAKGSLELRVQNQKEHYNLDTEYSIKNGGTLFVTAGPYDHEVLVVAITPKAP
jgi:hypothetical protein